MGRTSPGSARHFIGAVETHDPDEFLVKQPDARRPYQNLGVISFTTRNVMEEIYHGGGDSATWWDLNHLGHLIQVRPKGSHPPGAKNFAPTRIRSRRCSANLERCLATWRAP